MELIITFIGIILIIFMNLWSFNKYGAKIYLGSFLVVLLICTVVGFVRFSMRHGITVFNAGIVTVLNTPIIASHVYIFKKYGSQKYLNYFIFGLVELIICCGIPAVILSIMEKSILLIMEGCHSPACVGIGMVALFIGCIIALTTLSLGNLIVTHFYLKKLEKEKCKNE